MSDNLDIKIEEAIADCIERSMDLEGDARSAEIENAAKLYRARTDVLKLETELDRQDSINEVEKENKDAELNTQRKELFWKIGLGALQLIVPLLSYHVLTTRFMKFEQTGNIPTSPIFRNFMREIRPK